MEFFQISKFDSKLLWAPSSERVSSSCLSIFTKYLHREGFGNFPSYNDLHKFSLDSCGSFWSSVWDYCEVLGDKGSSPYYIEGSSMLESIFFPSARLNYAENLLERGCDSDTAIIFRSERGHRVSISRISLRKSVYSLAHFISSLDLSPCARICAVLPNIPETAISLLASSSLGYIFSSCSPDFGLSGLLSRFSQLNPELLICCDGYYYNGKRYSIEERILSLIKLLPSLKMVLLVSYVDDGLNISLLKKIKKLVFCRFFSEASSNSSSPPRLSYKRLSFNHPLYILFSSGTTGLPKCIIHRSGGVLLKHLVEHRFHCDMRSGDRLCFYTTCGWMMWNWLLSGLASNVTLLLYDGSPFCDGFSTLFKLVEDEKLSILGVSAKFIDSLRTSDYSIGSSLDISSLRTLISTGSPLLPPCFDYVYSSIKRDVMLQSISGGTEICGCFVSGNPNAAVYSGEIQVPVLGMSTKVYDQAGGELCTDKGELVCTKPFPSMPIGFWQDKENSKYLSSYFARYKDVWHQGDFASRTSRGGFIIHGRSDTTLNPGGVRIGTAEIYMIVESLVEIKESIAVGQDFEGDVRIILFVVLKPGYDLTTVLEKKICNNLRTQGSARHVPSFIIRVSDIPRTISGKISEQAVRSAVNGFCVENEHILSNPASLANFRDLAELQLKK